jgi:hypothetical protein
MQENCSTEVAMNFNTFVFKTHSQQSTRKVNVAPGLKRLRKPALQQIPLKSKVPRDVKRGMDG